MSIIRKIELEKERDLKSLIKKSLDNVEKGLRFLTDEFPANGGAIDLLCVDSGGILTIIELKINEDDFMLMQSLTYYDSVSQNIHRIAKLFPKTEINVEEEPRVILIAPRFSGTLKKCAKYLDLRIDLAEYDSLKIGSERGIMCRTVDIEPPKEVPIHRSVEDHLNYITNKTVRELCQKTIDKVQGIGEGIEVYGRKFYIGFKYKERLFARIKTYRAFFYSIVTSGGEWEKDKVKIEEKADFTEEHFDKIKKAYEEVEGILKE